MLTDLWRRRSLIGAFAQRDLATRYRSSALGWLWSLVQPLATLLIFSVVFSVVFRVSPPPLGNGRTDVGGVGYAAFIFTGMVAWNLMSSMLNVSMLTLKSSGELLKKVSFPAWAPVLGASVVVLIQTGLEFVVLAVIYLALMNVGWTWLFALPLLLGVALFAQGVGFVVAVQNAKYGDVAQVVAVVLGALYFLTPVLYPMSLVQEHGGVFAYVVQANPMTWFVEGLHDAMYSLQAPPGLLVVGSLIFGAAVFIAGLAFFNRSSEDIGEYL